MASYAASCSGVGGGNGGACGVNAGGGPLTGAAGGMGTLVEASPVDADGAVDAPASVDAVPASAAEAGLALPVAPASALDGGTLPRGCAPTLTADAIDRPIIAPAMTRGPRGPPGAPWPGAGGGAP